MIRDRSDNITVPGVEITTDLSSLYLSHGAVRSVDNTKSSCKIVDITYIINCEYMYIDSTFIWYVNALNMS